MKSEIPLFPNPQRAAFELTAWDVWEFFTEDDFLEVVHMSCDPVPDALGAVRKTHAVSLPNNVMNRNVAILRTREHEWTHFRQHISTQLGLFYHRLCAFREIATLEYFRELNATGGAYTLLPFTNLYLSTFVRKQGSQQGAKQADSWLRAWYYAEVIDAALWCKKVRMGDLIHVWRLIRDLLQKFRFFQADGEGCLLHTKRSSDDLSCPDGHITVQQLVEGFAKCREFVEIHGMYSFDDAIKYIAPTVKGVYGGSSEYIREYLGIPFFHPVSMALQEASLLCFVDPFLQPSGSIVYWEDIHPGLRFEQAVKELGSRLTALPTDPEDAYREARNALGCSDEYVFSDIQLEALTCDYRPIASLSLNQDYSERALVKLVQQYHKSTFIEAFRLRHSYPSIFFAPHLGPNEAVRAFSSLTRPPVIVGPEELFLPHGEGRHLSIGIASIYHALFGHLIDEITRDARLSVTKKFVERAKVASRRLFDKKSIQQLIRRAFGSCIEPHLNSLTGDMP